LGLGREKAKGGLEVRRREREWPSFFVHFRISLASGCCWLYSAAGLGGLGLIWLFFFFLMFLLYFSFGFVWFSAGFAGIFGSCLC